MAKPINTVKLQHHTVTLTTDTNQAIVLDVFTNMFEYNLELEDSVSAWLERTTQHTVQSFCEYVVSKRKYYPGLICRPALNHEIEL